MFCRSLLLVVFTACMPDPRGGSLGGLRWSISPMLAGGRPSLAATPSGDVALASLWNGGAITMLSARDGSTVWSAPIVIATADSSVQMPHVAIDRDGNALVTGAYAGSVDFGGSVLTAPGASAFVAKYAPDGTLLWARDVGPSSGACGRAIGTTTTGQVFIAGGCTGTIEFPGTTLACQGEFAAAFAPDGTPMWARTYPALVLIQGDVVTVTPEGSAMITTLGGSSSRTVARRYSATGDLEWSGMIDGVATAVTTDIDGDVVMAMTGSPATLTALDADERARWQSGAPDGVSQLDTIAVLADGRIVTSRAAFETYTRDGHPLDVVPFPASRAEALRMVEISSSASGSLAFVAVSPSTGSMIGVLDTR